MCGIAGIIEGGAANEHMLVTLRQMCDAIRHRGPEEFGAWTDESFGVGLGHRRLAIVDLSPTGHQPMVSSSGRYVVAFNGEIFNFAEIRRDLVAIGHAFKSTSDTEVLLEAVEAWGILAAVQRFVGMFAFGLWDRQDRKLHLVRDRVGEKPLYYFLSDSVLIFGSELKSLRAHPRLPHGIDRGALSLFMRHNYVPAPYTIYEHVFKLEPGKILTISVGANSLRSNLETYWSAWETASSGAISPLEIGEADAIRTLEKLIEQSVKRQMIADVPLGAFLSGGIDSSTIVALMQANSMRPVKTFTIGFREDAFNEAEQAKKIANILGTDHTEFYVTSDDALRIIPSLPFLYDEPFSDSSQIPTYLVSELARRFVTVSLSGDGGDELFSGYDRYFNAERIWRHANRIPLGLRRATAQVVTAVPPITYDACFRAVSAMLPQKLKAANFGERVHRVASLAAESSRETLYRRLMSHWTEQQLVLDSRELPTVWTQPANWAKLECYAAEMMRLDLVSYLPDDILVKVDRAAMGVSLETRVPFLDHSIVEFALKLPMSLKVRDGRGKWILRQVLQKYISPSLVDRPKQGFSIPVGEWLRGPLREWAEDLLTETTMRQEGYLNTSPIREKWKEHLDGRRNWQFLLWDVLMFQAWLRAQQ